MTTLFARHTVLPDADGFRIAPARVTLDGGWITGVEETDRAHAGDDLLGERLLTPAFVDAHTHSALGMLRGGVDAAATAGHMVEDLFFRVEEALTAEDVRAFTAAGALERLLHGTAVSWEHYHEPEAVLAGLQDVGLAGIVAPPLMDLHGPAMGRADHHLALTADLAGRDDLRDAGLGVAVGPHATDTVSAELWERAADVAAAHDLPVHAHVAQDPHEVARVHGRTGLTPLAWLHDLGVLDRGPSWLLVHGVYLTDAELALLDPRRHALVACLHAQARFAFPADVRGWTEAGARWCVATDSTAANDAADVLQELRFVASLATQPVTHDPAMVTHRRGADPRSAHESWTRRDEARAAGLDAPTSLLHRVWTIPGALHPALPCGAIAPGHLAHLALWDLTHPTFWPAEDPLRTLALGAPQGALDQVMVAGAWRGERGSFSGSLTTGADWRALRTEATARRAALWRRVGLDRA